MANYRSYLQGQSIDLFATLTVPETRNQPGAADRVFLRALARTDGQAVVLPDPADLAPTGMAGQFFLRVDSSKLLPGTYRYQIAALTSDNGVALGEDFFVVSAALAT